MSGQQLEESELEKDVGVSVTPSMKWDTQCAKAARTAGTVLAQISRAFSYRDKSTFMRLYKSYVRPHLEFSSPAWRPWLQRDKDLLERVQKRAVNMVGGLRGQTYEEKLNELGLDTLENRRRRFDLTMAHKVMHGHCSVRGEKWKHAKPTEGPRTRAAADATRLEPLRARLEIRRNFYTARITGEWNALPKESREITSTKSFKTALQRPLDAGAVGGRPQQWRTT